MIFSQSQQHSQSVFNIKSALKPMTICQVIVASLLIALSAKISIPLYFSPVPLSMQTAAVMLIGLTLGRHKAVAAVAAYILEGYLGLPVFAGILSGPIYLAGPTGGYIFAYLIQAYLVGWIADRKLNSSLSVTTGLLMGICVLQLTIGAFWVSQFTGFSSLAALGITPFLPGELLKSIALATFFTSTAKT